jgi:hypothetical protein
MRRDPKLLSALVALAGIALTPASAASGWKHQVIPNDGDVLTYSEGGKVTFYLGCGRGFALHMKYPGVAPKEGKARITISNGKASMAFDGEFEAPVKVEDAVPMNFATEFRQTYLGYAKHDPAVFGKKWNAIKSRLLDMLDSRGPITISAGKDSYRPPPVDAGNWHKGLEACRN